MINLQRMEREGKSIFSLGGYMKPILPSLREKNRYVAYKVKSEEKLGFGEVKRALEHSCLRMMGQLQMASSGFRVMNEWQNNMGIIKINNQYLNEAHASLLFIKEVNGKKAALESVYTSGVVNKVIKKLFFEKERFAKEKGRN